MPNIVTTHIPEYLDFASGFKPHKRQNPGNPAPWNQKKVERVPRPGMSPLGTWDLLPLGDREVYENDSA